MQVRRVFESPDGHAVLADLSRFCHAYATTHCNGDTHGTAQLEGRRQVWLRLTRYLNMTDAELADLARAAEEAEE